MSVVDVYWVVLGCCRICLISNWVIIFGLVVVVFVSVEIFCVLLFCRIYLEMVVVSVLGMILLLGIGVCIKIGSIMECVVFCIVFVVVMVVIYVVVVNIMVFINICICFIYFKLVGWIGVWFVLLKM